MSALHETPEAAARRLSAGAVRDGFAPEALHTYTDRQGEPLYWRIRAKNAMTGAKWIRPMKRNGVGYMLGEPAADKHPDGKPLYRLHELTAQLVAVVIVTEGEFKADKLSELGLLVTTSGAADSASNADWRPLAGRDVLIWPDHDEAGQRYAKAVASELKPLGSTVRVLDVAALELDAKGDAVDWLAVHPDATAADVLALACAQDPEAGQDDADGQGSFAPCRPGPAGSSTDETDPPNTYKYGSGIFTLTQRGVVFIGTDKDGEEKAPVWVCSPLGVIAKTRDAKSGEWGRLLEWFDDDGVKHQWAMPLELLEGDGIDVRKELARMGLHTGTTRSAKELLTAYIKVWPVDERARCVDRLGWYGPVFTTPSETIGDAGEIVVFQNAQAIEPAFSTVGTVESWRETVGALSSGNTRLMFAVSVAFAGTLAGLIGEDSGGFQMRGKSSTGKSTALRAAASVWGNPDTYMRLWRATANGLEGLAAIHNDGILILDELSQCDPKQVGEAAYMLANGQGKARANQKGAVRASQRWRLLFLSSGEVSLSTLMAQAGRKANAGQEVRLADFDGDAGAGHGAFEELHRHPSGAALSIAVKDAATLNHGAVGLAWLHHVVDRRSQLATFIPNGIQRFVAEAVPAGAAGQVERVARRFALVAMAGELASHFGLTGWVKGEAERAAKACFSSWLEGFGGIGNREERDLLAQVRAFFEAHGASRFEDAVARADQRIVNRAGFYRTDKNDMREYLVLPEAFKNELCKGRDAKTAEKLLVAKGWVEPARDGRVTQKPRLPGIGTSARVYVFTNKVWEDEE